MLGWVKCRNTYQLQNSRCRFSPIPGPNFKRAAVLGGQCSSQKRASASAQFGQLIGRRTRTAAVRYPPGPIPDSAWLTRDWARAGVGLHHRLKERKRCRRVAPVVICLSTVSRGTVPKLGCRQEKQATPSPRAQRLTLEQSRTHEGCRLLGKRTRLALEQSRTHRGCRLLESDYGQKTTGGPDRRSQ